MKRKMSCKKLRKLLIDRDMKRTDLRKDAGISSSSLAKLGKDENVTTDVLLRICDTLDVDLNDIAETVQEEEEHWKQEPSPGGAMERHTEARP